MMFRRQNPLERMFGQMLGSMANGGDMFDGEGGLPSFFGENARVEMTEFQRDPETGRLKKMIKKVRQGDYVEIDEEEFDEKNHHVKRKITHKEGNKEHVRLEDIDEKDNLKFMDEMIDNLDANQVDQFEKDFEEKGISMERHKRSRLFDFDENTGGFDPFQNMFGDLFGSKIKREPWTSKRVRRKEDLGSEKETNEAFDNEETLEDFEEKSEKQTAKKTGSNLEDKKLTKDVKPDKKGKKVLDAELKSEKQTAKKTGSNLEDEKLTKDVKPDEKGKEVLDAELKREKKSMEV